MCDLREYYWDNEVIKRAYVWLGQQQEYISEYGEKLNPHQIALAIQVGVRHPERIRVLVDEKISSPSDESLKRLAEEMNFLGLGTLGITLGYCIYVHEGYVDERRFTMNSSMCINLK